MQTTSDRNKRNPASPNATEPSRQGGQAVARRVDRRPEPRPRSRGITATMAGRPPRAPAPPLRTPPAHQAGIKASRSARRLPAPPRRSANAASRATEQAGSAMAKVGETAQDLANRAGEQRPRRPSDAPACRQRQRRRQQRTRSRQPRSRTGRPGNGKIGETAQDWPPRPRAGRPGGAGNVRPGRARRRVRDAQRPRISGDGAADRRRGRIRRGLSAPRRFPARRTTTATTRGRIDGLHTGAHA